MNNRQKSNWIVDALLFGGFLVSFALDWTGVELHQWIGVTGGTVALWHLARHWDWVKAVARRFASRTSRQARTYALLDAALLAGFLAILVSGLGLSTWLGLDLADYSGWVDLHVTTSIVTLALLVLKIGLHWRWIVRVGRGPLLPPNPSPALAMQPAVSQTATPGAMTRRDFLKLMGIVGAASLAAFSFTLNGGQAEGSSAAGGQETTLTQGEGEVAAAVEDGAGSTSASPTATTETVTQALISPTEDTTTLTASCSLRCDKHCSYPGHCHRYQDANANNLCDLGECL